MSCCRCLKNVYFLSNLKICIKIIWYRFKWISKNQLISFPFCNYFVQKGLSKSFSRFILDFALSLFWSFNKIVDNTYYMIFIPYIVYNHYCLYIVYRPPKIEFLFKYFIWNYIYFFISVVLFVFFIYIHPFCAYISSTIPWLSTLLVVCLTCSYEPKSLTGRSCSWLVNFARQVKGYETDKKL